MQEMRVRSLGWGNSWSRKWQPTPVFLPGKSYQQRSLVGYSPWGHKESGTTGRLSTYAFKQDRLHCENLPESLSDSTLLKVFEGPPISCSLREGETYCTV